MPSSSSLSPSASSPSSPSHLPSHLLELEIECQKIIGEDVHLFFTPLQIQDFMVSLWTRRPAKPHEKQQYQRQQQELQERQQQKSQQQQPQQAQQPTDKQDRDFEEREMRVDGSNIDKLYIQYDKVSLLQQVKNNSSVRYCMTVYECGQPVNGKDPRFFPNTPCFIKLANSWTKEILTPLDVLTILTCLYDMSSVVPSSSVVSGKQQRAEKQTITAPHNSSHPFTNRMRATAQS